MTPAERYGMPFSFGVLGAGGDLVGAAAADQQEGAVLLDHLPADLDRVLRVELVVAEDDPHLAAEELDRVRCSARNCQ